MNEIEKNFYFTRSFKHNDVDNDHYMMIIPNLAFQENSRRRKDSMVLVKGEIVLISRSLKKSKDFSFFWHFGW